MIARSRRIAASRSACWCSACWPRRWDRRERLLARSLTAPIGRLADATRQVAAGDLDVPLPVTREDEIGRLARSFQQMTAGLRERAEMQKFVSQSTMQMIHSRRCPSSVPASGAR